MLGVTESDPWFGNHLIRKWLQMIYSKTNPIVGADGIQNHIACYSLILIQSLKL